MLIKYQNKQKDSGHSGQTGKGKSLKNSVIPVYNAIIHWEAKIIKKRMPVVRHSFIFIESFIYCPK